MLSSLPGKFARMFLFFRSVRSPCLTAFGSTSNTTRQWRLRSCSLSQPSHSKPIQLGTPPGQDLCARRVDQSGRARPLPIRYRVGRTPSKILLLIRSRARAQLSHGQLAATWNCAALKVHHFSAIAPSRRSPKRPARQPGGEPELSGIGLAARRHPHPLGRANRPRRLTGGFQVSDDRLQRVRARERVPCQLLNARPT
jgi:hypothetical protein